MAIQTTGREYIMSLQDPIERASAIRQKAASIVKGEILQAVEDEEGLCAFCQDHWLDVGYPTTEGYADEDAFVKLLKKHEARWQDDPDLADLLGTWHLVM